MSNFEPWRKYPDLTRDRLSVIATMIRDVRHGCVLLHDPDEGDGPWSLGCRAYERICLAIRKASRNVQLAKDTPGEKFTRISVSQSATCRFASTVVTRKNLRSTTNAKSYGEIHHIQLCLALDLGGDIHGT